MAANEDLHAMRQELLSLLAASLKKNSRFYDDDYASMREGVNRKTRAELIESIGRQRVIAGVTPREIAFHCQLGGLPTPSR